MHLIFMHSKQGQKTTVPHHLHTLQHKPHYRPTKTKKHTIYKTLMFKYLPKCVLKSLNFFFKIFGGYKKKL